MNIFVIPVNALTITASFVVIMSVVTFTAYGWDKYKARKGKWRTPEATLLWLAFLGGALGALLGMLTFRHKTKHKKFQILVPLFLILQAALAVYLLFFV